MVPENPSRRLFLGASAGAAALGALPRTSFAANEKPRLALIGAGSRGNQVLDTFLARKPMDFEFVGVVDVDDQHADETAEKIAKAQGGKKPKTGRDYRPFLDDKGLDAVVIATPDHWHAIPAIHACQAGKDVYVEKPVAHNVAEGQAMLRAARKYERVMAVGTQQRSSNHFQEAVQAIHSGKIGQVFWVQTWNFENISPVGMGNEPDSQAPPHVDYDRWLGPAREQAFNKNRFHLLFRWFFEYAGGMMSDWGVHLNDIVLWAIKEQAPRSVSASGGIWTTKDNRDTPDTLQVVYDFPTTTLTYSMRKGNGHPLDGHGYGIQFYGTDGTLFLDRSGWSITPDKISEPYGIKLVYGDRPHRNIELKAESHPGDDGQTPHIANFLDCLKTRKRPTCDIEIAHKSTNTCHLGNIAYVLGRKLAWDDATETFTNDAEANKLLTRVYRKGYELPDV